MAATARTPPLKTPQRLTDHETIGWVREIPGSLSYPHDAEQKCQDATVVRMSLREVGPDRGRGKPFQDASAAGTKQKRMYDGDCKRSTKLAT